MKLTGSVFKLVIAVSMLFMFSCSRDEKPTILVVEGVRLDITQAELIPGDTITLTATLLPYNTKVDESTTWDDAVKDAVYWRTDNPQVAQVDDKGFVTAKGVGTCKVSFVCGSYAADCKISVRSFNKDILYGLWEMPTLTEQNEYYSFYFDNTGHYNERFFDWTFDGMRLKIYFKQNSMEGIPDKADKNFIITSVSSGALNFYFADDAKKSSLSMKKKPKEYTVEQIEFGQTEKPGLGDSLINVVDLGLPSGLLWATCNLGAASPEQDGFRYAWAETAPKRNYSLENYKWYNTSSQDLTKYADDNTTEILPADDPVSVTLGEKWHTPTAADVTELVENCNVMYGTLSGVEGIVFIPKNEDYSDKWLFVPFSLSSNIGSASIETQSGYFWTSTLSAANSFDAYSFSISFDKNYLDMYCGLSLTRRFNGMCIRPVFKEKN